MLTTQAIECFRQLLKLLPYEMSTVRELAHLYSKEGRIDEAVTLYENTSNHYITTQDRDTFNWSELNIMAELYMTAAESTQRAELWRTIISRIKSVARWLRGRQFENWWNDRDDDAEWDLDNVRRKSEPKLLSTTDYEAYRLPIELRVKLGKARLMLRNDSEALKHFEFLEEEDPDEMFDLFSEAADALLQREQWREALDYYAKITDVPEANGPELWFSMAKAFKEVGEFEQAEECLNAILANAAQDTEALVALAEVYECTDRRQDALETINRVIEIRRPSDDVEHDTNMEDYSSNAGDEEIGEAGFFAKDRSAIASRTLKHPVRKRRPGIRIKPQNTENLADYEARKTDETKSKFMALHLTHNAMLSGDVHATEQWMTAASDLIDDFRIIRAFYPSEKKNIFRGLGRGRGAKTLSVTEQLQGMATRLEESITAGRAVTKQAANLEEFRGFTFAQWLEVFLQYSLLLVLANEELDAYAVLDSASSANVFYHDGVRLMRIQVMKMILTILAEDVQAGGAQARWLMLNCLFRDDALRFYGSALASGSNAQTLYNESGNQKFLLRYIKTMDVMIYGKQIPNTISIKELAQSNESMSPANIHPILLLLYGHLLSTGRGYVPSLRAYYDPRGVLG